MVTPVSSDKYIGEQVAGQFHIRQRIGAGGMGSVYKAEQPDMNRHVAVKILHPRYLSRPDLVSRFRREARAMSHLSHPNTARVFLYGQLDDGACYFVMEYLEGRNLAQTVRVFKLQTGDSASGTNATRGACAARSRRLRCCQAVSVSTAWSAGPPRCTSARHRWSPSSHTWSVRR